jgi:ABC-type Fe3+ transport system permease subunit
MGRVLGGVLLIGLMFLGLASWPSAFLDRGATGSVRVSVFPLALTLFDPFVWICVRNSLVVAGLVAVGSLVVGVGLAMVGTSQRFRGRSLLWALALVPVAAGPLLVAPGIGFFLGGSQHWNWLAARSILGFSLDELVRWTALGWVGLATGAPIVALATSATLRKLEPAWTEAAKSAGASPVLIWREILWPILRPDVARACAAVFTLTFVEPAGPLILGLNRTLAFAILEAATRFEQPTRAAALALLAVAFAALGRTLILWWGGPTYASPELLSCPMVEQAGLRRAWFSRLILFGWAVFAVGPLALLVLKSFQILQASTSGLWTGFLRLWFEDSELHAWIANSATTAGLAVLIDLVILRLLLGPRPDSSDRALKFASWFFQAFPPLALGVGAYSTPWLLEALADSIGGRAGDWTRGLALELNPARSPGFLLILVIAAGKLPILVKVANLARAQVRSSLVDASKLMGISDHQASLAGQGGWIGLVPGRALILVFALATTNLAPALLMSPFSERRPIAPAILLSIVREGSIDSRIAAAIAVVLAWKLTAFVLASRSRVGMLGDWFRG